MPTSRPGAGATALGLAALVALSCGPDDLADAPHIVIDTLRADRTSVHGYERPTTPAMERLARDSVVFDDCWAPAPWTGPSHASLFTGMRPEEHGFLRSLNAFLPDQVETLAEQLLETGFETHCFATNPNVGRARNLVQGFDHYEPCFRYVRNVEVGDGDGVFESMVEYQPADATAARVVRTIVDADAAGRRVFTFVNLLDPHLSYDPPPGPTAAFVRDAELETLEWARRLSFPVCAEPALGVTQFTDAQWAALSDLYDAEVRTSDDALDVLVSGLRKAGLLDSTLLVITSDHGEFLGEEGLSDHAFHMRPELLRIPLVVRWPDGYRAGERVADLVRLEDVTPTVLEACGMSAPASMSGRSLRGDTTDRVAFAATDPPTEALTILADRHPSYPLDRLRRSFRSVADGRWHYLRDDVGTEWLWDLDVDPTASENVATTRPEERLRLRSLLHEAYPGW